MEARNASRVIGVLILAEMVGGYVVNFALAAPAFAPPGFLVNAASYAFEIAVAVLLGLATSAIALGIAVLAYPVFVRHSRTMALGFVALAAASLAIAAVEYVNLMSMLSLSEAYTKAGPADRHPFETFRAVVAAYRNWAHYIHLIVVGAMLFLFYGTTFRFALVPRALAGLGLAAVALQIVAVAMPLFGHAIIFPLLAPLGLAQLLLAIWLIAKGFRREPAAAPSPT